jgi:hypothetical protein
MRTLPIVYFSVSQFKFEVCFLPVQCGFERPKQISVIYHFINRKCVCWGGGEGRTRATCCKGEFIVRVMRSFNALFVAPLQDSMHTRLFVCPPILYISYRSFMRTLVASINYLLFCHHSIR